MNSPSHVSMSVRTLAANFLTAKSLKVKIKRGGWSIPMKGHGKLIVDAAFDPDSLRGAVGALIRDDKGNFIAAASEKIELCSDVFMVEAMALRFGLNLAQTVGCNLLVIKSDNIDVVSLMQEGRSFARAAVAIFDDCYHMSIDLSDVIY